MKGKAEQKIMENLESIENWASLGISQREIAKRLEIGYSTFRRIKMSNLALLALFPPGAHCDNSDESCTRGKVKEVVKSLYERAKGYDYEKTEYFKLKSNGYDDKGKRWEKEELVERKVIIHVPADVQAAKFYLINRDRQNWKDNPAKIELDKQALKLREKEIADREW